MKFHKLYVNNFLTIGQAAVDLDGKGLNIIQGVNDDDGSAVSNGAGKSSLVDAILWVLFGATARKVKGDKVVNNVAGKNTHVKLSLSTGDSMFIIERFRKHKDYKNELHLHVCNPMSGYEAGAISTDLSKGTDAGTQKEVERILGCSYEVFMAAVYSGQEVMPDLPMKTDKELKTLIEEASGLQRIERAYELSCKRRITAKTAVVGQESRLEMSRGSIVRIETGLAKVTADSAEWETGRVVRIADAKARVSSVETEVRAAAVALIKSKPAKEAAAALVVTIDAQLADHKNLEGAARVAEHAHELADRAIDRAGVTRHLAAVATIEKQIDNAEEEMKKPCGECGKPHTADELDTFKEHLNVRLEAAKVALTAVANKVIAQEKARAALVPAKEAARAAVPDVSAAIAQRAGMQAIVSKFDTDMKAIEAGKRSLAAAKEQVEIRTDEPNPHTAAVKSMEGQAAAEHSNLATLLVHMEALKGRLEVHEHVARVFGPAGVRAEILDTVTPFLNDRTADYLSVLSDGNMHATWTTLTKSAAGELKEKFSIEVSNDKGSDSFLGLSGGEKRKVRLACALALQDLVASRATQPIDLWIGDEIDDALDPAGLERLMTILERKARERGTVLVISHNSLADWCDNVTTVRKSGGVSKVEGALCV